MASIGDEKASNGDLREVTGRGDLITPGMEIRIQLLKILIRVHPPSWQHRAIPSPFRAHHLAGLVGLRRKLPRGLLLNYPRHDILFPMCTRKAMLLTEGQWSAAATCLRQSHRLEAKMRVGWLHSRYVAEGFRRSIAKETKEMRVGLS